MKLKHRNPYAAAVTMKKTGGPMRDSRLGRGGSKNKMSELWEEFNREWVEGTECNERGCNNPECCEADTARV